MATKTINVIMHSANHTPTAAGWNKILHSSTGTFALNFSDGEASPFSLVVTTASTSNLNNSAYAAGDKHGIPQDVIKGTGPYVGATARVMSIAKSGGDNTITNIALWGASAANDAQRAARWTVSGVTYDHDDRNYGDAAPTNANTSGATYPIAISVAKTPSASFGYPNVLILTVNIPDPAQTITSINGGAGIKIGSTGNTAETTGFTSDPDTITIGSLSGTVTAYNSGTGQVAFSVPAPVHEASYPDIDSTQTVTISNDTESADLANVPFDPPLGSTPITVASPVNDDDRYLGYWMIDIFGINPVDGDKFYGIDADVTWAADTGGSAVGLPVTTPVTYWDASTGIAYNLMVTVNPDGVASASGLSVSGVSVTGLSVVGLSVTGL